MNEVVKQLSLIGIVPVIKIDNAKDAAPLAKALIDGGLPCAEVTFRTAAAKEAMLAAMPMQFWKAAWPMVSSVLGRETFCR